MALGGGQHVQCMALSRFEAWHQAVAPSPATSWSLGPLSPPSHPPNCTCSQGVEPYVVHATFQRFSFNYQPSGKRGRFREFGLWLLDPPGYYRGRFLSYDNNVLEFVHSVVKQHGGLMPVFYKHWLAVSYQYALFTEALALAAATNRTVVLPQSWCWCDYDHVPHVMEVRGAGAGRGEPVIGWVWVM